MDQIALQYSQASQSRCKGFFIESQNGAPDQKSKRRTCAEVCHSPFKGIVLEINLDQFGQFVCG